MKALCCGYSLEVPQQGTSNEYTQRMFLQRNKNLFSEKTKKKTMTFSGNSSDLELWQVLIKPGPEVMKLFSCSTQLSMKFSLLINMKNANKSWHFHIYKQRKFHAQQCFARKN